MSSNSAYLDSIDRDRTVGERVLNGGSFRHWWLRRCEERWMDARGSLERDRVGDQQLRIQQAAEAVRHECFVARCEGRGSADYRDVADPSTLERYHAERDRKRRPQ